MLKKNSLRDPFQGAQTLEEKPEKRVSLKNRMSAGGQLSADNHVRIRCSRSDNE